MTEVKTMMDECFGKQRRVVTPLIEASTRAELVSEKRFASLRRTEFELNFHKKVQNLGIST